MSLENYRYQLLQDYGEKVKGLAFGIHVKINHEFYSVDLYEGYVLGKTGYAWDGSSVVPDGKKLTKLMPSFTEIVRCLKEGDVIRTTTRSSLGHDILFQALTRILKALLAFFPKMTRKKLCRIFDRHYIKVMREDGAEEWRCVLYEFGLKTVAEPFRKVFGFLNKFWR